MKRLLVTTDFSGNSRAGIRFAMQLSAQSGCELVFYHIIEVTKPTSWNETRYKKFASEKLKDNKEKLMSFVSRAAATTGISKGKKQFVVEIGTDVVPMLIRRAKKEKADAICISTHGAGNIQKIFGTNSSTLITSSPVPVIVVPKAYKVKPVSTIMYASDMASLDKELKVLLPFAKALKATTEVYHYDYLLHVEENRRKLEKKVSKFLKEKIQFRFKKQDIEKPLSEHLRNDIAKSKPSMVVLFTKQNRNWFDRLFLSSEAADLSFHSSVPLLTFRKK